MMHSFLGGSTEEVQQLHDGAILLSILFNLYLITGSVFMHK